MSSFTIIFIILIVAFNLNKDYQRDKGFHKKAKIFHAILMTLVIIGYRGSFGRLGLIVGNTSYVLDRYNVPVGMFSNYVNLSFFFLEVLLSVIILVLSFKMLKRKEQSRKFFITYLPFLGITSIFDFYRGWIVNDNELFLNDYVILAIGTLFMGGIIFLYYHIYNSFWMKSFFNFESESKDEKIDLYE